MPWKGEKDPYKIWLSEIILQQTRVEQGWAYYLKFIKHYPNVKKLATAAPDQVFKDWEGLGYYTRCKNLLHTASVITEQYGGKFPNSYDKLLKLKGVGPYTAAAIAAFAFNQPYAVVDGNVFRVLSRVFGIGEAIDSTNGKRTFDRLAQEQLDQDRPAAYNQAIMDFGATVCKPSTPICSNCPMANICIARKTGRVMSLPVKEKTLQKKTRHISWLILAYNSKSQRSSKQIQRDTLIYVRKRTAGDVWENLHEFFSIETPGRPSWTIQAVQDIVRQQLGIEVRPSAIQSLPADSQQLTHQKIFGTFYVVHLDQQPSSLLRGRWCPAHEIPMLAFPKLLKNLQINFK